MKVKFVKKQPETSNVYTFIFEPPAGVSWQPGQYLHYELPHSNPDKAGIERWFTISAAPFEKHVSITTRIEENSTTFKQALKNLAPGQEIEAGEPRGSFTYQDGFERHIFIAGGIGITPYHSILFQRDHDGKKIPVTLMYGNRDEELVFGNSLRALESGHPEFKLLPFIGKRISEGDLKQFIDDESVLFYISGPKLMVENYQQLLIKLGVPDEVRIKTDYFPGYEKSQYYADK